LGERISAHDEGRRRWARKSDKLRLLAAREREEAQAGSDVLSRRHICKAEDKRADILAGYF
jgi:hypothetical protein